MDRLWNVLKISNLVWNSIVWQKTSAQPFKNLISGFSPNPEGLSVILLEIKAKNKKLYNFHLKTFAKIGPDYDFY